jgi:inhibitor of the pro-sigma K processing machinery
VDINVVVAVVFGLIVLYFVLKMLAVPARFLLRLLSYGALGSLLLLFFNVFAGHLGVQIGINAVTALIVGYLGGPGLVMLVLVQRMLA